MARAMDWLKSSRESDDVGNRFCCQPFSISIWWLLEFRQLEENHSMENVIYNELKMRGFNVDVGRVEVRENQIRRYLEVDFVANQGSQRYYVQSAYRLNDEEKVSQEKKSLRNIPDSFKKLIIEENDIVPYRDDDGFVRMGLFDFLLNPSSLEF